MLSKSQKLFFYQFRENFFSTGAILPSSQATAQACTSFLAQKQGVVQVLEAGPGTGAFTKEIIRLLQLGDSFDLIEINPLLAAYLRQQIQTEPDFQVSKADMCLINADLRRFPFNRTYDYIISSLPFSNFPPELVEELLEVIITHLKPGGIFSYIKYIFIGRVKYIFSNSNTKEKIRKNEEVIAKYARLYQIKRQAILANVPPTWVYHWRKEI